MLGIKSIYVTLIQMPTATVVTFHTNLFDEHKLDFFRKDLNLVLTVRFIQLKLNLFFSI